MPHTPQALVFPPLQRVANPSARAAETAQFEHAAEAIRPSWPALPKPSAPRPALVRGAVSPLSPLSPFDAPRTGAEAVPSFAPRAFDAPELEENPFKRPRKSRSWVAALLVIAIAALGWMLTRGEAPSAPIAGPTRAPSVAPPQEPAAPAASPALPTANEPAPPTAAAPRAQPPSPSAVEQDAKDIAAPIKAAPADQAQKAERPAPPAKQPAIAAPVKKPGIAPAPSTAKAASNSKPQPLKPAAQPAPQRTAPKAQPRPAAQRPSGSLAPPRHQSAPIQANPYD